MSEQADRDALAEAIAGIDGGRLADATMRAHDACLRAADAILASDWLAQRDRRVRAEALREAAAQWASQYDEQTRDHGSRHAKSRAALRMASVLADQRADRIEAES